MDSESETAAWLASLSPADRAYLAWQQRWAETARPSQIPPEEGWTEFGALAGRGYGKTRVGAEWLARVAYEDPLALPRCVVAPTQSDVKFTCFEGESGLLAVVPPECVANYNRSDLVLTLTNGAMIRGFSAEKADRLRGPQHADAWCFSGDTQIATLAGSLAIANIRVGDYVLTRKGPRRVLANSRRHAAVGLVRFSTGAELLGTADHPVYTTRGWTRLDQLREGDTVCALYASGISTSAVSGAARASNANDGRLDLSAGSARRLSPTTTASPSAIASSVGRPSAAVPVTYAASVASIWRPEGERDVFCLKVEDAPEYFANGILVHNCDELAAWGKDAEDTWDMLMFGMRLGEKPRVLWTTTPKPNEIVRRLTIPQEGRIIVRGSTFDNRDNLPDSFFKQLEQYEGTKIGRQELYGELIDPEEAGIVQRSQMRLWPATRNLPKFIFIVLSLDTAFTEQTLDKKGDPDYSACTVWGVFEHEGLRHMMLLDSWHERLGMPDLVSKVKRELNVAYGGDEDTALIKPMFGAAKPTTSGRKVDLCLIEDKGSGISLRQMLEVEGIHAFAYNPGRADKLARLHAVSPVFARKRIWLPESAKLPGKPRTWAEPMIAQLCSFAGSGSIKHDDYVDSVTQAIRVCIDKGLLSVVKPALTQPAQPRKASTNPYAA